MRLVGELVPNLLMAKIRRNSLSVEVALGVVKGPSPTLGSPSQISRIKERSPNNCYLYKPVEFVTE